MKHFKKAIKYLSVPTLAFASVPALAEADATITAALAPSITNAGDTAVAVALLLMSATVIVLAAMWAWGMLKKGKNG